MQQIDWNEFIKVELRIGTIIKAEIFKEARKPAYKLEVDFGEEIGIKKSSVQITEIYTLEELIDKQVIGVINFPAKQIGPIKSEVLITGFHTNAGVVLAVPDKPVKNGAKLL